MNALASTSKLVARQACPLCSRRLASNDAQDDRKWWQRRPQPIKWWNETRIKGMLPIFRPYLYDVNYARKARELSDETYPQSKPLIRGGLADDRLADESLGTIVDPQTGVVIPEEKLWRETKVRQYGEQLPTEHRIMTPLMRYSPLTLVYMANLVRRLPVEEGLLQLQFLQKRMAPLIREEIFQGYLEAIRRGLDREKLVIDEIKVLQSKARKSLDLRAQGQIRIIRSRTCRMIITLKEAISPLEEKRRKLEKALKRRQRVGGAMASTREHSFNGPTYLQGKRHRW